MKIYRLLILFAFLLAGCAAVTPTLTVAPAEPRATITPQPVASRTVLIHTLEPTPQFSAVPATSTPDIRQQEKAVILPLVTPCNFANQAISYSPSRAWVMASCLSEQPAGGVITKLARMDGSQQWSLSLDKIYLKLYRTDDVNLNTLLQKSFIPVRWTKDENFVYLAVQTSSTDIPHNGCLFNIQELCPPMVQASPYRGYDGLFRVNLSTGKISPTLKPVFAPLTASYTFKFSPSGTKLAYFNQSVQPLSLAIADLVSGGEENISLEASFSQGGSLLWSPDEKKLVVSVFDPGWNKGCSVIVYDLETLRKELVVQQSANVYFLVDWVDATTIYAQDDSGFSAYLDLTTKKISSDPYFAPTESTPDSMVSISAKILASRLSSLTPQPTKASEAALPTEIIDAKSVAMRLVPSGEFVMGENVDTAQAECKKFQSTCNREWFLDEEPAHIVYLDAYYMDVYEVTNLLYKACVEAGVCAPPEKSYLLSGTLYFGNPDYDNYPVVFVDLNKAQIYCEWRGAYIPTEAQWEKAARGTDGRSYPWGEEINGDFANYGRQMGKAKPVGSYENGKSPYGMYDMVGNVWEWVADAYDANYYKNSPASNPYQDAPIFSSMARGGSWSWDGVALRLSNREKSSYPTQKVDVGFRCASSPQR